MIKFTPRQPAPNWLSSSANRNPIDLSTVRVADADAKLVHGTLEGLRPNRVGWTLSGSTLSIAHLSLPSPHSNIPPLFFSPEPSLDNPGKKEIGVLSSFLQLARALPDGSLISSSDCEALIARARCEVVTGREIAQVVQELSLRDGLRAVGVLAALHDAEMCGQTDRTRETRWSVALLSLSLGRYSGILAEAAEQFRSCKHGGRRDQVAAWTTLREFSLGAVVWMNEDSLAVLGNLSAISLRALRKALGKCPPPARNAVIDLAGVCGYSTALAERFVAWVARDAEVVEIALAYASAREHLDRFEEKIRSMGSIIGTDRQVFADTIHARSRRNLDRVLLMRIFEETPLGRAGPTILKLHELADGRALSAALTRALLDGGWSLDKLPNVDFVTGVISSFDPVFIEKLKRISRATVYQIYNQAGGDYFYGRFLSTCGQGTARLYALLSNGDPVSFLIADDAGERTYLGSLNATFPFLGSGAGSKLLAEVIAKEGGRTLFALVHPDNPVLKEVTKLGFQIVRMTESGLVEVERRVG